MLFAQGAVISERYDEAGCSIIDICLPKKDYAMILVNAGVEAEKFLHTFKLNNNQIDSWLLD